MSKTANGVAADRKDVLLAALGTSPSRSLTPVQVQKTMFLIDAEAKQMAPTRFYRFEKYNYGPFSQEIYSDLAQLENDGLVIEDRTGFSRVRHYRLTDSGVQSAKLSCQRLNPSLKSYLLAVVGWVTSLTFPELVRAIYKKYPAYKENSVFSG
jgi:uncharacterized protein YwgA